MSLVQKPLSLDASAIRFLLAGIVNTLGSLAIIYLAKVVGIGDMSANAMGYGVGIILSFVLNKKWTFQHDGPVFSTFVRFVIVIGLAYLANLAVVLGTIYILNINSYIAQALGIPLYTSIAYIGSRWYVFSAHIQIPEQSL